MSRRKGETKYTELGIKLLVTLLIFVIIYWFVCVHFLGRHVALTMHATLLSTKPEKSPLSQIFPVKDTKESFVSQWSTQGRYSFREQSLTKILRSLHRIIASVSGT